MMKKDGLGYHVCFFRRLFSNNSWIDIVNIGRLFYNTLVF